MAGSDQDRGDEGPGFFFVRENKKLARRPTIELLRISARDQARFWANVERRRCGCWIWTGASTNGGYGVISLGGRKGANVRAPRISYFLANGEFDETLYILHRCDTPACVNPDHLFIGTQDDNMKDMFAKGRGRPGHVPGAKNGCAKITTETAAAIRVALGSLREIGERFGISKSQVWEIKNGMSWAA